MCSHTHDYREHQGYSSGIADKTSDQSSHKHYKQEKPCLAGSGKLNDLTSNHLGQTSLEDSSSHDEQPDHHYHSRVGEACEGFRRAQDLA